MEQLIPMVFAHFLIITIPALAYTTYLAWNIPQENAEERRWRAEEKLARLGHMARFPKPNLKAA